MDNFAITKIDGAENLWYTIHLELDTNNFPETLCLWRRKVKSLLACLGCLFSLSLANARDTVKIGLNYPKTGPYSVQGLAQWRAAELAVEEINGAGGILGKRIEIAWRDSQSRVDLTRENVRDLIENEGVKMVFGGSASSVAIAAGDVCQGKGIPFFGTLTYSTATTCERGRRHTFREC